MFLLVGADPLFAFNHLTLFAGISVIGGLYLFFFGFRLLARKRLLINTPTSKIRSASLGLIEVSGTAVGPYTLPAPITGIPCLLYRTIAWQKNDERRNKEWKKVAEETLHVPFFLDDGTGQLLIQPQGAELDLHRDFQQTYSDTIFAPHAGREVLSFLARNGVQPDEKIRIEEFAIRPQSKLFVVGTLAENNSIDVARGERMQNSPNPAPVVNMPVDSNIPPPEIIRLSEPVSEEATPAQTQQSKIAAALLKAGITKPAAWEAAGISRTAATQAASPRISHISVNGSSQARAIEAQSEFDLHPRVVLKQGENEPSFLISWRSQHDLVRSLAWKSAAMIWFGGGLALLGIYVIGQQLQLL